jgi:hypothetical protein
MNLWVPGTDPLIVICREAGMTHWHDAMIDRPEADGAAYATGWTISGLAVIGTIVAVWVLGI